MQMQGTFDIDRRQKEISLKGLIMTGVNVLKAKPSRVCGTLNAWATHNIEHRYQHVS